ncbi:unnamed protein product [marine sediment metagenome]|uniref:Uncharacterized protein n=1 Tax=marine sediment metagenome TaxID=412755 RepID=X1HRR3_9ZZZZ
MTIFPYIVGTAVEVKIASVSPTRTSIVVVVNNATATLYTRFSKGVAVANGFPIYSYGFMSLKIPEDDPTKEIWAISDTATTQVRVYEGYGKKEQ